MCGIAAVFAYGVSPNPQSAELLRMREAMLSRGPDDGGHWVSPGERVQLAHRRLAIIELSPAGAQPMQSADGSLTIVFNGEIYNHQALRKDLETAGRQVGSESDTEVLLHLYAVYGTDLVHRIRGMYAFALWDERRGGLFLARDPLGIKPLYYSDDGNTLRAASQVKALVAGGAVDTSPDPAGHVGFFLWGHIPCPHTLYRGVRSLAAGTTLWIDRQGRRTLRAFCSPQRLFRAAQYGKPGITVDYPAEKIPKAPAGRERIREVVMDSVRHHLHADVPVGLFLSAGLDSGTLALLAAEHVPQLNTITLGFEEFRGTPSDETVPAEQIAARLGARHHTAWFSRRDFTLWLPRFLQAMDQPSIDGLNTYLVSQAAACLGIKVALSGLGADELFGGYPSFSQIPPTTYALAMTAWAQNWAQHFRTLSAPFFRNAGVPKFAGLLEYGGSWAGAYLLKRGLFMPWELPEVLDPEMARAGWDQLQPLLQLEKLLVGIQGARLKISCLESCFYLHSRLLRDADWAGLAHSVEIRTPFVDLRLLQQILPLCTSARAPSKADLASICGPLLPNAIRRRPKTGFAVPLRGWIDALDTKSIGRRSEHESRAWARFVYGQFVQN